MDRIEELAKTSALDDLLLPLETGLTDLPEVHCGIEAVTRLRNGNPAEVFGADVAFGEEAWVSHDGQAIAVGKYMGGSLHPARVFNASDDA